MSIGLCTEVEGQKERADQRLGDPPPPHTGPAPMEHGSGEGHNNSNFGAPGGHMATPLACFDKVFSSVVRCGAPPSIWDPKHQSVCEVQRGWFGDGGRGVRPTIHRICTSIDQR